MAQALALANNDVAQLNWQCDAKIPDCLGFAIHRGEGSPPAAGKGQSLPAWVGFEGQSNPVWHRSTTTTWPIQKFEWRDLTARRGKTYGYRIVPMVGTPDALTPREDLALTCGPVTLTPHRGSFSTYFNRGLLSTQFLVHQLPTDKDGKPDTSALMQHIATPGDPLRKALAGQILEGLEALLDQARREGGSCFAALYELADTELVSQLEGLETLHLILTNTDDGDQENQPARQALHALQADGKVAEVIDRFVASNHIGHNKFVVYVDSTNAPRAVLLGSTNWTDTAVCGQSNNALIVEHPDLAQAYLDYWNRLKADTTPEGKGPQSAALRQADGQPAVQDLAIDSGKATLWFSPNTPHPRRSPRPPDEATPVDLADLFARMQAAHSMILFLVFEPGIPSIMEQAAIAMNANPSLFVRGAATDPNAVGQFNTTLIHRPGEDPVEVVAASAIDDPIAYWEKELLKASPQAHAIIHDKIVVIDPDRDDCVVVTGSHNLGFKASYNNDENLLIVAGHRELAQAYAVHVLDVYDHYRFRYLQQQKGNAAYAGLATTDAWQDRYFDPSNPASSDPGRWFTNMHLSQ
jgi:phosphatidylserine/phosphatidylglycerophosphate/cardiolipin synthase-like enzyme